MGYWAKAPIPREQIVLFTTTLDDCISDDHPVRLFAEILAGYDWSDWEAKYNGRVGQPPIHPRILAIIWLYGLRRGVRSSRKLEYMARNNIDFMWAAEGHAPDYSTLSGFRSGFKSQLDDLFRHIARVAMKGGFLNLVDVAMDGTRVKANNSRFQTWTAERIGKALDELAIEFQKQLAESKAVDDREGDLFGEVSLEKIPPELADLKKRAEKLKAIQTQLNEADEARRKEGIDPAKNPAQIPKHDPDSRILPNKEGGYAANYTPLATTEGHGGYIVDADVIVGPNEHQDFVPSIDRVTERFGQKPEHALADGAFGTGPNIAAMEAREIEFFSPIPVPAASDNPALRPDPTQPVPEADWSRLPIDKQTKTFAKACFIYDAEQDIYHCPLGAPLPYAETKSDTKGGEKVSRRVYRSEACATCPLQAKCVLKKNLSGQRTVSRDVYTPERERMAAKMQTPEAKAIYDERMRIAETPFGIIKNVMGLRQFLLRGLEKVKTEWLWTCTAFNLGKLSRDLQRSRAQAEVEVTAGATN